ncbi:carboxymuconolactone decarboxylase family protein [Pantoea phytobeneficialis]|uniref:4-carboxymuconolactone decarboxylase n=1 Tax=Pantoea phytobeneficialis TaxID=2052056 RepID=A0AAP9HCA4_9GAMM|nr:carboxymuconolactone decarboxylase family protein [Pantoea phytobeneficialis]MDO6409661.1 carboxymuconolactone decarboxylase family protein [Pantoea phytobeneficialis]QGR10044.1 4-carboxymuconolactone decarboxylase [Pantoea phytobeneficialis]
MNTTASLNATQRAIIPIAAWTAKGDLPALSQALNAGLDSGLTINEIKEVLLQMYAYCGFPRSLNGITTFMSVIKQRAEQGINDPVGKAPSPAPQDKSRTEVGSDIQTLIAGRVLKAEKGNFIEFLPEINQFLQEHLFADVIARDNLGLPDREIATIAALTGLGGVESQLKSHIGGGLNVGLTEQQVKDLFVVYGNTVVSHEAQRGMQLLDDVMASRPR